MNKSGKSEHGSDAQIIQLKPVGIIRNESKDSGWGGDWRERAAKMKEQIKSISELVIDARLEGILDGIEEFSHLTVFYWAHLSPAERSSVTRVRPMGNKDFPLVGVFATHSPIRPNSILATVVQLIERKGNILEVTGLDALNGSPILDIKPYQPYHEPKDIRLPEWIKKIHDGFTDDENSERSG